MRRADRQVVDINEIASIISKCSVCRLGMTDNGKPYIIPMNYGFEFNGSILTLYFHSARAGKKIDILQKNPHICFEMDCGHELIKGATACSYGYKYESVIGYGNAEFVEEYNEKVYALKRLMAQYTGISDYDFSTDETKNVEIIKVCSHEYTAKRH